jgi:hypothetical protein
MHKNATKCNKTLRKWCKNKHGASKIIDTFEMYHQASEASWFYVQAVEVYLVYVRDKSRRKASSLCIVGLYSAYWGWSNNSYQSLVEDPLVTGGHDEVDGQVFWGGRGHAGVDDVPTVQP